MVKKYYLIFNFCNNIVMSPIKFLWQSNIRNFCFLQWYDVGIFQFAIKSKVVLLEFLC